MNLIVCCVPRYTRSLGLWHGCVEKRINHATATSPQSSANLYSPYAPVRQLIEHERMATRTARLGFDQDPESAVNHSLAVERHRLWVHHPRQARVLHHLGVDAVAMRARLEHDPRKNKVSPGLSLTLRRNATPSRRRIPSITRRRAPARSYPPSSRCGGRHQICALEPVKRIHRRNVRCEVCLVCFGGLRRG